MDHKPILVSWSKADKLHHPVSNSVTFLKPDATTTTPVLNSSQTSSHRTLYPYRSLEVGPALRPCMSNLFRTTSRNYWQQIPSLPIFHFIGVRSLDDVRSLEDGANLGVVATRGLVSDKSTSAFPGPVPLLVLSPVLDQVPLLAWGLVLLLVPYRT
jgi:hypothetical protein